MADVTSTPEGGLPRVEVLRLLQAASREVRELDVGGRVDVVPLSELSPLRFATQYVARNKPLVITGALDGWPAMRLWGERYLANHPAAQSVVTVDVTPNGRGDAITAVADPSAGAVSRWFVTPHERRMRLVDFFRLMRHQNSNLSEELGGLMDDIGPGLAWAEEVFGGAPEATNLWIGDGRSATSFHKAAPPAPLSPAPRPAPRPFPPFPPPHDHYENLYAVLRGTKTFTLLPPCDAYRMYLTRAPAASYMPYTEVPPGARYAEVSPRPGCAPPSAGRAGEPGVAAAASTAAEAGGAGGDAAEAAETSGCAGRLVADPGYEVLWSAVDTTTRGEDPAADAEARAAQPLFYGPSSPAGSRAGGRVRTKAGDGGAASCSGGDSDGGSDCEADPWDAAGGPPLVVDVGPGQVLYLPSLWYHQVEQREGGTEERRRAAAGRHGAPASRRHGAAAAGAEGAEGAGCSGEGEEEYVIAVNFWYDMKYDSRYSSFKLVEALAVAAGLAEKPPEREAVC
ncbi:hypothetical protein GPECTOR_1g808 [Gonium pectorale]|uniref:JmjC domain-containing protein n=1 Tax=Gonium pectorale TaxID=33097 RepID=A0A150H451_GONPE|nr:hypothetical protein GPECTOR_1g808 [Gonium pectorale]|eukprot:KXZ56896.1 hypothetical protein GPECTOR_1g808 [Gonium pectorale]